jgi:hypothetical protein
MIKFNDFLERFFLPLIVLGLVFLFVFYIPFNVYMKPCFQPFGPDGNPLDSFRQCHPIKPGTQFIAGLFISYEFIYPLSVLCMGIIPILIINLYCSSLRKEERVGNRSVFLILFISHAVYGFFMFIQAPPKIGLFHGTNIPAVGDRLIISALSLILIYLVFFFRINIRISLKSFCNFCLFLFLALWLLGFKMWL